MGESLLHELLSHKIYEFRQKLEKEENNFTKWIKEHRDALEKTLSPEQLKLVDRYTHSLALREEDIEFQVETAFLNTAIKIGMQLQKAFDKEQ